MYRTNRARLPATPSILLEFCGRKKSEKSKRVQTEVSVGEKVGGQVGSLEKLRRPEGLLIKHPTLYAYPQESVLVE